MEEKIAESKKYKITYGLWWEAVLEIKDDEKTKQNMKDQILFFIDGERSLKMNNGNVVKTYLEHISIPLIKESMEWRLEGVKDAIADEMYEGYLPLDGSFGITLISIDCFEFDDRSFDYEDMTQGATL